MTDWELSEGNSRVTPTLSYLPPRGRSKREERATKNDQRAGVDGTTLGKRSPYVTEVQDRWTVTWEG